MFISGSRARVLAETAWGTGGTHGYRTNRKGAFYYSCAGHGGYIVDGAALTEKERYNIDRYIVPSLVWAIIDNLTGIVRKTSNPFSTKRFHARFYQTERLDKEYSIYYFEEDCDWAILEKFTDIRAAGMKHLSEAERNDVIERTFDRWAEKIAA